jgi:hypothetical protein
MTESAARRTVRLQIDGEPFTARDFQTIAAALLASGRLSWRTTARYRKPRGVFCGIGVCFDCLLTVNGVRDVRSCQRRAVDGDVVETQAEELPSTGAATDDSDVPRGGTS